MNWQLQKALPSQNEWGDLISRSKNGGLVSTFVAIALYFLSPSIPSHHFKEIAVGFIFVGGIWRYFNSKLYPQVSWVGFLQFYAVTIGNCISWAAFLWPYILAPEDMSSQYKIFGFVVMTGIMVTSSQIFVTQTLAFYSYCLVLVSPAIYGSILEISRGESPYMLYYLGFLSLFLSRQRKDFVDQWRALEASKKDLQGLINNFPGAISLVRNGRYIYANSEVARVSGLSLESILDQPVGAHHPSSPIPNLVKEISESRESLIFNREVLMKTPRGNEEHLVFLNKIQNGDIIIVSLNVSFQRALERELVQQKAKAENSAKMAALGEMSGGLSHEINNPLAILMGNNHRIKQVLSRKPLDETVMLRLIDSNTKVVERIAKIVTGLKNFARDGARDPFAPVSLTDVVNDTLTFCETRFENHNIAMKKIGFEKRFFIECRAVQVSQVILNVLNNAHDALETATTKWIEIELIDKEKHVQIVVRDSGLGVPLQVREKLMQPFFTTKEIGKGTGLGLSISKGLIEDHNGRLYFDFEQPVTTVIIELPKKQKASIRDRAA